MTTPQPSPVAAQRCINADCRAAYPLSQVLVGCPACGWLLDVEYHWARLPRPVLGGRAAAPWSAAADPLDFSGVWRFRDLLPFFSDPSQIVTVGEGRTILQRADTLAGLIGLKGGGGGGGGLHLQYEGFNPSGSFKDNGMAAAFTHAKMVGATRVACASTGNTSASLALYGAHAGMQSFVFIGDGKIAFGKLSQALDYGATTLQVAGDFDACLARVVEIAKRGGNREQGTGNGIYLMNSLNPFRLEGQKTIMYRVLEGLQWNVPDWIVVPGGNLGNCSAFGKAFIELKELGLIKKLPRLAVIQAKGARTLDRVVNELGVRWTPGRSALSGTYDTAKVAAEYSRMTLAKEQAHTLASAIEINRPVNLAKALRALHAMNGVVRSVGDEEILESKALIGRHGYGCEPASAASVAGLIHLIREGVIAPHESVACILTGHALKDPDATVAYHTKAAAGKSGTLSNAPIRVKDELEEIVRVMDAVGLKKS